MRSPAVALAALVAHVGERVVVRQAPHNAHGWVAEVQGGCSVRQAAVDLRGVRGGACSSAVSSCGSIAPGWHRDRGLDIEA